MEIKSVTLQTDRHKELKSFYTDLFGFPLIKEEAESFRIAVGNGELEFTSKQVTGSPYYHFALNIPANKYNEAKSWVQERVHLNTEDGVDEADFAHMSAHAFYFYDSAGNIVEFISRHTVSEESGNPFSAKEVLNISEIGVTVDDAVQAGGKLIRKGIRERDNEELSTVTLNFMGDKSKGIFIILNQPGRRWIFSDKESAVFPLEVITSAGHRIVVDAKRLFEIF
ncbi:VOC family protein [Bacillus massiliglaciei]|uniref:VOC family protein n=1 Tax=Bacillus massiliglaciei TaxID=1816693 RepID=UPI000DA63637|nr:VOC family protein [Bacillus massiliglaciei]